MILDWFSGRDKNLWRLIKDSLLKLKMLTEGTRLKYRPNSYTTKNEKFIGCVYLISMSIFLKKIETNTS